MYHRTLVLFENNNGHSLRVQEVIKKISDMDRLKLGEVTGDDSKK